MLELRDHVADKSNQVIARRRPGNKGRRYPADPPRVEEIVAVMRQAGTDLHGRRLRGLIIVLWRAGLRISEAYLKGIDSGEIIETVRSGRPPVIPAGAALAS